MRKAGKLQQQGWNVTIRLGFEKFLASRRLAHHQAHGQFLMDYKIGKQPVFDIFNGLFLCVLPLALSAAAMDGQHALLRCDSFRQTNLIDFKYYGHGNQTTAVILTHFPSVAA